MAVIRLIHWNADEARERAERLRGAGYDVIWDPLDPDSLRALRQHPPDAVLIDLARLPSQGRDVGLALRKWKATRGVPLVFVEGDPQKVARIKELLPDAVYTTWRRIRSSLKRAIAWPPAEPVTPSSTMAGYSGAPLLKKLGIKAKTVVVLVDAPDGFEETLGPLPEGVMLRRGARGRGDLVLYFTKSRKDLTRRIERLGSLAGKGGLWVVWPKKASGVRSDLTQPVVRKIGLDAGLVDYKVCAVDATWTGLRFARRKSQ